MPAEHALCTARGGGARVGAPKEALGLRNDCGIGLVRGPLHVEHERRRGAARHGVEKRTERAEAS